MKIIDESILFFSKVSLSKFSRKLSTFRGCKGIIVGCMRNTKSQLQPNRAFWWLELTTGTSREFESWVNCLARLEVLSCSAIVGVTLQLPCMLHTCATFGDSPVTSQSRDPVTRLFLGAHSWTFLHTFSYTTLTWFTPKYRISKCWINKANKMIE